MKNIKILMMAMMVVGMSFAAKADDDRVITFQQLPAAAQAFHKAHFSKNVPLVVTMDWDDYTIVYESGEKVEFDRNGEWKDIDCRMSVVPSVLVPEQIKAAVKTTFPAASIVKIDRNRRGYEVKLNNGMEVEFNRAFQVIDIDD
ncbi:MAG: PepSY-like domain-containing protein [Muribaculaceae bacterium]|nr:PepSY-like domain-containing protein [Muribaculaceae bacterium]